MPLSTSTSTSTIVHGPALTAVLPKLLAMSEADVLVPRIDATQAILVALGAMPDILTQRAAIAARFGAPQAAQIDDIELHARAFQQADAEHTALTTGVDLTPLVEPVIAWRTRLGTDADVLVEREILDRKVLSGLVGGQSYEGRIADVALLVQLFRVYWARIAPHTCVTQADLDAAEAAMVAFSKALAEREQFTASATDAARLRARAYTLFYRTYESVRRRIVFLRWAERDHDRIAPSLHSGKGRDASRPAPSTPVEPGLPGADPVT